MNPVTGPRVLAVAGAVLAVVMVLLMIIGTTSQSTFITWCVLALVGAGMLAVGQRLDAAERNKRLTAERNARIQARRDAGPRQ